MTTRSNSSRPSGVCAVRSAGAPARAQRSSPAPIRTVLALSASSRTGLSARLGRGSSMVAPTKQARPACGKGSELSTEPTELSGAAINSISLASRECVSCAVSLKIAVVQFLVVFSDLQGCGRFNPQTRYCIGRLALRLR